MIYHFKPLDERVPVSAIDGALAHWDSVLKALAR